MAGGLTKSSLFNQIQADTYGVPVLRGETTETTALGCAILAGVNSGIFKNFQEAVNNMSRITEKFEPLSVNQTKYEKLFAYYKKFYSVLDKSGFYNNFSMLEFE